MWGQRASSSSHSLSQVSSSANSASVSHDDTGGQGDPTGDLVGDDGDSSKRHGEEHSCKSSEGLELVGVGGIMSCDWCCHGSGGWFFMVLSS